MIITHKEPFTLDVLHEKALADLSPKIKNFVESYLHPYITRQCTLKNIEKPMMSLLVEHLKKGGINAIYHRIEEIALSSYLEAACLGFYVNQSNNPRFTRIDEKTKKQKFCAYISQYDRDFELLVDAVKTALPIDFPNVQIDVKQRVALALVRVNELRREAVKYQYDQDNVPFARFKQTRYDSLQENNGFSLFNIYVARMESLNNPNNKAIKPKFADGLKRKPS